MSLGVRGPNEMNAIVKAVKYLAISVVSSFVFAVAYVIVMSASLPKTDAAYGRPPFADPFVRVIMLVIATASAVAAWPFYAVLGWRLPVIKVGVAVGIPTLIFILIVTPFHSRLGWVGSYVILLAALITCNMKLKPDGESAPRGLTQ